ncbi:MAG: hypothetical protein II151_02645, partial [Bacteroidales bacterium]|nr:hypothetical protein [Bacteroidales bacterium]
YGCTSLTTTPILHARTLVNYCYKYMFANCSNLQAAKIWATDISAEGCLDNWLLNVSSSQGTFLQEKTVTFPTGPSGIPENWIKVVYP